MTTINVHVIAGNLTKDPEITRTPDGKPMAVLAVETKEFWKDRSGKQRVSSDVHRVVVHNPTLVDMISKRCKKGVRVKADGPMKYRQTVIQGVTVRVPELVVKPYEWGFGVMDYGMAEGGEKPAQGSSVQEQPKAQTPPASPNEADGWGVDEDSAPPAKQEEKTEQKPASKPSLSSVSSPSRPEPAGNDEGPSWEGSGTKADNKNGDLDDEIPF